MRPGTALVFGVTVLVSIAVASLHPYLAVAQTPDDLRTVDLGQVQFAVPRTWQDQGTRLSLTGAGKIADYQSPDGAQEVRVFVDNPADGTTAMSYLQADFNGDLYESGQRWLQPPTSTEVDNADDAAYAVAQHTTAAGTVRDIAAIVAMQDGFVLEFIVYTTDDFASSHAPLMRAMLASFGLAP